MTNWTPGTVVARRDRLGLQPEGISVPQPATGVWLGIAVHVVEDTPEHLVTFASPGAEFGFPEGDWPTEDGRHAWSSRDGWQGHGCLMMQRPGDHVAIWHFWGGEDREFIGWYLNLQTDVVRHEVGFDTQDLELDVIVYPDGTWELKDDEVMEQRVAEGRFSPELVAWVRSYGSELTDRLDREGPWWDRRWVEWNPDPSWRDARLPADWLSERG